MNINPWKMTAVIIACVITAGCAGPEQGRVVIGPPPPIGAERTVPVHEAANATLQIGSGKINWAYSDQDGVWFFQGKNLLKLDPVSHQVVTTISGISKHPSCAFESNAVWILDGGELKKFDPDSGRMLSSMPTKIENMRFGMGSIWMRNQQKRSVTRINPETQQVISTIGVGKWPRAILITENAVWVMNMGDGTVSKIDPKTDSVVAAIRVGSWPTSIFMYAGAVWVFASGDGTISRIDPKTDSVAATIKIANVKDYGSIFYCGWSVGAEGIWITKEHYLMLIDPVSNQISKAFLIGSWPANGFPNCVVAAGHAVWVARDSEVLKIDPQDGRVTEKILMPANRKNNLSMVAGNDALWVFRAGEDALWRIDLQSVKEKQL